MRRAAVAILTIAALGAAAGGAAAAVPTQNDHNCAGFNVSQGAGPGFGSVVSGAAHQQQVDNSGFADCGQMHRRNPL
ncbi:MAG TPA: hypothetical protein VHK23_03715 [Miltoncostaeaceae bacterium]|jgi:hypothetical protein|nr:hypothetical protein [Miltoncostaeaceae bacterium]